METLRYYLGPAVAGTEEAVAPPVATIEDVLRDIREIETQGLILRDEIRDFPDTGGTLMMALAIHNDTAKLQTLVDKAATDVKNLSLPISVEDGTKVLDALNEKKPLFEETLKLIVEKKAAFEALPPGGVPSIIKFDLTMLHDRVILIEDAAIAASPPELLEMANRLKAEIEAIFDTAIAAYS